MKSIITHAGAAHRDEVLAIAILLARYGAVPIYRRDPTPEELADPEVFVVDVGLVSDGRLHDFDHHQFGRDAEPLCALSLVLQYLGQDLEKVRRIWPWLRFTEELDSKGPFFVAKRLGLGRDAFAETLSPVESGVLHMFESETMLFPECLVVRLLEAIGKDKLAYLDMIQERLARLQSEAVFVPVPSHNFELCDARCIPGGDQPVMGLELFLQALPDKDVPVTLTNDDRATGLCLFRRNDDPRIDLSRIDGLPGVRFAHRGGFVAKLEPETDPVLLLEAAIL